MYIDGLGLSGYKSFTGDLIKIGPFSKINLLIGQNNSGKSNVLSFIHQHYGRAVESLANIRNKTVSISVKFDALDKPIHQTSNDIDLALGLRIGSDRHTRLIEKCAAKAPERREVITSLLDRILTSEPIAHGGNVAWFYFHSSSSGGPLTLQPDFITRLKTHVELTANQWLNLWANLEHGQGGSIDQHWIPQTLAFILGGLFDAPPINMIPAIRRVGEGSLSSDDYSGIGIIDRLAQLQNPPHNRQDQKEHFREINTFLRTVTGNESAQLEIPYERNTILVHMDNRTLPLSSLGTGIHEVVILAAAATVLRDQVLCIEEPELHLHPLLQRKLIRYLSDKTNNQYFFTTHSAHLLDSPDAEIFHVRHQNGRSTVDRAFTAAAKSLVCVDLGYRASDLLQANCIIWVEGPSDRVYLNHWLGSLDSELIEGVHYSIMFYGGRLLSHLSALDPEVDEFISLRRLNRYIAIVIDSDKSSAHARLNDTKSRVRSEFDQGPGFAWITKGREIENYIRPSILETAVKAVHPSAVRLARTGQFDHCLYYKRSTDRVVEDVDKVKIAHEVTKAATDLDMLDLKKNIQLLVKFIRSANDFEAS